MKKMNLNADELRVESFAIAAGTAENGTVNGHGGTTRQTCADSCDDTSQTYACACLVSVGPTYCFCEDDTIGWR
jgi:hypothetical protein